MKNYFLIFSLLVLFTAVPGHASAGSPFLTPTTGFSVTLTSPPSGGQALTPTTISGTYDSSLVPASGYICMIPWIDAPSWNSGGVSHLLATQVSIDFTNSSFAFSPNFLCWLRPASNSGSFAYNYPFSLAGHTVGIFAMALNASGNYCGAGANAPCYTLTSGYNQSFGPISFTVVTSIPNNAPTATITSPTTNPYSAAAGTSIFFNGSATDPDSGDYISTYEWRDGSCTAGTLLQTSSYITYYSTNTLSVGSHDIYFRAKDSHGAWSPCATITISITPAAAPTVSLNSYTTIVYVGNSATLHWWSSNADSCTASGDWSGAKNTSYTTETTAAYTTTGTYTYNLSCTGTGGTTAATPLTITVVPAPAPNVSFFVSPTAFITYDTSLSVTAGSGATAVLSWYSGNASSCTASGSWSGTKTTGMPSSSPYFWQETVGPYATAGSYPYTLTCTGAGGTTSATVTVTANPACSANQGNACSLTSPANACGQTTTTGNVYTIACDGTCSGIAPSAPPVTTPTGVSYGGVCSLTSTANACGQTTSANTGSYNCSGVCAGTAPDAPAITTPTGVTYGGACSLTSAPNACGQTTTVADAGTYSCAGTCTGTAPDAPAITTPTGATYGAACNPTNVCGMTNPGGAGTVSCDGTCSVSAPADSACIPTTPTLSALWQGSDSTYVSSSPTAPAYDPSGYQLLAQASSPSGANLNYYFEWSPDETAQWSGWTGSGGWGSVTHYVDVPAGTYYARAWAYDANNNWSLLPSDWMTITLTTAAPTVSCVGTPGNPYVGQSVSWTSSVSGGSRSYTYEWSGTDGLLGSSTSVSKTYTTIGQKSASLTVTDTKSGLVTTVDCSTGVNQPDGPTNGGTCPSGVCPGTCTSSLSANPDPVDQGNTVALTWSVTGNGLCASSCSGHGFETNNLISGSANVVADPKNNNFALTCYCTGPVCKYGPPPETVRPVTVWVPTATLTANGQSTSARVNPNTSPNTTIVWSSDHASSCTGTNFSTGDATSGTVTLTTTSQTVYKVDCKNSYDTHATASVMVNVLTSFNEF